MATDGRKIIACGLYTQGTDALIEISEWLKNVRKRREKVEKDFLKENTDTQTV